MENTDQQRFTATHHALLFACLSRAIVQSAGQPQGEAIVRRAVRRYGEQRGHRMALRAQASGEPLTMDSFLANGELGIPAGEQLNDTVQERPDLVVHVLRCPWHQAWEANGLTPYGRLYCLEVDHALVRGFNPELWLDVNGVLTSGDPCCEFVFHQVKGAAAGRGRVIMPWEYHAGHLFKTISQVAVAELGPLGGQAVRQGLADWSATYGAEAARVVTSYADADFDRLPG